MFERRFYPLTRVEVRAGEDSQVITGYAAVYDTLSVELWGFRERIAKGAFRESLEDDVRALWNHETGIVLGRTKSGTLRLRDDPVGLHIEIDPPASATAYVESIQRGDVDQMSFGFRVLEDTWDENDEGELVRTVLKVKLYEVSPVTFPAYPATSVGVREGESLAKLYADGFVTANEVREWFGIKPEIPASVAQARADADGEQPEDETAARARRKRHRELALLRAAYGSQERKCRDEQENY